MTKVIISSIIGLIITAIVLVVIATHGFVIGTDMDSPEIIRLAGYLSGDPSQKEQPLIAKILDRDTKMILSMRQRSVVKELIHQGFSVNQREVPDGFTPLYAATNKTDVETTKLLLENGADPNALIHGENAADCYNGGKENLEILKLLVEHGWNLSSQDQGITKCLKRAKSLAGQLAKYGRRDDSIVEYLEQVMMQKGIPPNP